MADGASSREIKFRDAALVLAEDATELAGRLTRCVRGAKYARAEELAGSLQRTARDAKWLLSRQPKEEEASG